MNGFHFEVVPGTIQAKTSENRSPQQTICAAGESNPAHVPLEDRVLSFSLSAQRLALCLTRGASLSRICPLNFLESPKAAPRPG